jgi:hypothetical protein
MIAMPYTPPDPPEDLHESGSALWLHVATKYEVAADQDRLQLVQVCRTADLLDRLQAVIDEEGVTAESSQGIRTHPAVVELRQQRIVFARLLAALGVPSEAESARGVYAIRGA